MANTGLRRSHIDRQSVSGYFPFMPLLENAAVVLARPKFPENIGSAARACLNMGCPNLILVDPDNFDLAKAMPLATLHAKHILEQAKVYDDLATALAPYNRVFGTTARLGGWRKSVRTTPYIGGEVRDMLADGQKVAFVFGREDTGMENSETTLCTDLVTIPTSEDGTSLNLSQAVLVVLYEVFKSCQESPLKQTGPRPEAHIPHEHQEALLERIQEALLQIDFLKKDNPDYWMLPIKKLLQKFHLRRNEYNILMGICRQINWLSGKAEGKCDQNGDD